MIDNSLGPFCFPQYDGAPRAGVPNSKTLRIRGCYGLFVSIVKGEIVRHASLKMPILALVIVVAFAMVPTASASSIDITAMGTVVGTATLTQGGTMGCGAASTDVCVSITMNSGTEVRIGGPTIAFGGDINVGASSTVMNISLGTLSPGPTGGGGLKSLGACPTCALFFQTTGPATSSTYSLVLTNADVGTGLVLGVHVIGGVCGGPANNPQTCFGGGGTLPSTPEPGMLSLFGTGLAGIVGLFRKRLLSSPWAS